MNNELTNKFGGEFWDERYSSSEWIYGTEPNRFFREELDKLNSGKILLLGEGEGRNAVYAALSGWQVDAVDFSKVAREKALNFAKQNSVSINYKLADLSGYELESDCYDVIAIIYSHLKKVVRERIHSSIYTALKAKGIVILEAFDKDQLGKNSGGPQNIDMLYSVDELAEEFARFRINTLEKKIVTLDESIHHKGEAVVVRLIASKL